MIDYTEVRRVVEKHIEDNYTGLRIVLENTTSKPVQTEHIALQDGGDVDSERMEMSSDILKVTGILVFGIFTRLGSGTDVAREEASKLDALFKMEVSGIFFLPRELKSVGKVEDAPLYQHNLTVPYSYFYGQDDTQ